MKLLRKTERLTIRPLRLDDYAAWKASYVEIAAPKNIWDSGPRPATELTLARFKKLVLSQAKHRRADRYYDLAIFLNPRTIIGRVSVMDIIRGVSQTAFLGYGLFNTHWGQGYAQEAVLAGIDIAFNEIGLHRIEAGIEPENLPSIKLAKRLGLRREGLRKRAVLLRGRWVDLITYSATSDEFGVAWKGAVVRRPQ